MQTSLLGSAGVYFVASRLNAMQLQCAATFGNVPSVDILVSSIGGSALISLQVKTTTWGIRSRGRGDDRKPDHYEWEIGWKSARLNNPSLLFALVDLKNFEELPDVFIVPSKVIARYFSAGPEGWPRARYHESIKTLEPFKNDWKTIMDRLTEREHTSRRTQVTAL
ncbi:MAG TPA: hypothetical protein VHX37_05895 [Acidobacteriaceae bacterium]|jgi:hypothetical protein|nr:hypothetical protein [Acidobacteriaceae bacterium]